MFGLYNSNMLEHIKEEKMSVNHNNFKNINKHKWDHNSTKLNSRWIYLCKP